MFLPPFQKNPFILLEEKVLQQDDVRSFEKKKKKKSGRFIYVRTVNIYEESKTECVQNTIIYYNLFRRKKGSNHSIFERKKGSLFH